MWLFIIITVMHAFSILYIFLFISDIKPQEASLEGNLIIIGR